MVTTKATPTLFPDVKEHLTRLKGKSQIAVLSNGDLESLDRAVRVLHVAAYAWDIRDARAAGTAGAYINRYSIPYVDADGSQADLEVSNLPGLADRLTQ